MSDPPVDPMDVNACLVLMMTEPEKAALAMHYLRRLVTSYRDLARAADRFRQHVVNRGDLADDEAIDAYDSARAAVEKLDRGTPE